MKKAFYTIRPCICLCMLFFASTHWAAGEEQGLEINGKPLEQLLKELQDQNRGKQVRAAKALSEAPLEMGPKLIPILIPLLAAERENTHAFVAQALGRFGSAARGAVPRLLPLLDGTQFERNRAAAAKALGQILENATPNEEVEKVTTALTQKFNEDYDKYSDVRREAVYALGMIGPAAKSCIPKLTRALTDYVQYSAEHQMVRAAAAWTCGRMGPLAAEHMDRLISMMHAEGHEVPEIVEAIGRVGPLNDNVVNNIIDKIETSELNDNWLGFKIAAWGALERFGPKAAPAIPLMKRFLPQMGMSRAFFAHREALLKAVGALGQAGKELAPLVEKHTTYVNNADWQIPDDEKKQLHESLHKTAQAALNALGATTESK